MRAAADALDDLLDLGGDDLVDLLRRAHHLGVAGNAAALVHRVKDVFNEVGVALGGHALGRDLALLRAAVVDQHDRLGLFEPFVARGGLDAVVLGVAERLEIVRFLRLGIDVRHGQRRQDSVFAECLVPALASLGGKQVLDERVARRVARHGTALGGLLENVLDGLLGIWR